MAGKKKTVVEEILGDLGMAYLNENVKRQMIDNINLETCSARPTHCDCELISMGLL